MKLSIVLLIVLLSITFAQDFPLTVSDGANVQATFEQPVTRIVCLSSSCQDHLFILGLEPLGIPDYMSPIHMLLHGEDAPESIFILATDLSTFEPDLEEVLALQPDVVIGLVGRHDGIRAPLEDLGVPVLLSRTYTFAEARAEFELVATITDQAEQIEPVVSAATDRLNAYRALSPNDTSLLLVFGSAANQELFVETDKAQTCHTLMLYELVTCPARLEDSPSQFIDAGYGQYSVEGILNLNPEFIFFAGYDTSGDDDPAVLVEASSSPLWAEISAVKNDHLYSISAWEFGGQSGFTLLTRAVDQTMQLLYPEVFPESLTDAQVQEVLANE
ncbi:MAG: ABC transporter substrate-binding protein [Deinococcota bacterium]